MTLQREGRAQAPSIEATGEVSHVTRSRDKVAALGFIKNALRRHDAPEAIMTDGLRSHRVAINELGKAEKQRFDRWASSPAIRRSAEGGQRCCVSGVEDGTEVRLRLRQE
ncbi:DDE-type integrase/transposase/recombinase [Sphingomonas sp. RS2018]